MPHVANPDVARWSSNSSTISVLVYISALGCQPESPAPLAQDAAPATTASAVPQANIEQSLPEKYYRIVDGRDIIPALPVPSMDSAPGWHYRVRWAGGRIVSYNRINPAGAIAEDVSVEYMPDGKRTVRTKNAYGAPIHVDVVEASGLQTRTLRSGEVLLDGCYRKLRRYDTAGRVETEACVDDTGRIVMDAHGCFIRRHTWGPSFERQSTACLQDDSALVVDDQGIHRTSYDYDSRGNLVEESFYSASGERTARRSDGCARMKHRWDSSGNEFETHCLSVGGQIQLVQGAAYAIVRDAFDANGCKIERRYFEDDTRPGRNGDVARSIYRPDQRCGVLFFQHQNAAGQPVMPSANEPSEEEHELNAEGLPVVTRCRGAKGPASCTFLYENGPRGSVQRDIHDEHGRVSTTRCFDTSDKPSRCSEEYPHEWRYEYGADGRRAAETFADEKGQPAFGLRVARIEYRYNALGRQTTLTFLDRAGRPMVSSLIGFASTKREYDQKNRLAAIELRGLDGKLVANTGVRQHGIKWPHGTGRMAIERGTGGELANLFYAPDGTLVKKVDCKDLATPCYRE